jgi:hypothetical protein
VRAGAAAVVVVAAGLDAVALVVVAGEVDAGDFVVAVVEDVAGDLAIVAGDGELFAEVCAKLNDAGSAANRAPARMSLIGFMMERSLSFDCG